MSETFSEKMRVVSVFVFIGFLMTIGMAVGTVLTPEAVQFHDVVDPQLIIDALNTDTASQLQSRLFGIVLDNFFIIGYLAIFYGLYLLVKDKDEMFSKIAFIAGSMTALFDMIENAIHVALINGVPVGWNPDPLIFVELWTATFIKDITSYMAGMIFVVLLLLSASSAFDLRMSKVILAILVGLYVALGSIALVIPEVLTIRNLSFMFDMGIGSYLLHSISKKPSPSE